jgi:hypothetical protein
MEADWEFEVGGDAPVIEAAWTGYVDLQRDPERAGQLPEAGLLPGLAETLIKLNTIASSVWTSKCDVWPHLEARDFDLDELDAPPGCSAHAMGCYIDLLPRGEKQWLQPEMAADACKQVCGLLRAVPLRCSRADLVIRLAFITPNAADTDLASLGVTAYLTSCGESHVAAAQTLQAALGALADALGATRR